MRNMFVKNSTGILKKVLMCRPTYLKPVPINEIAKKWKDTTLDIEKMEKEHKLMIEAYESNGVEVVLLDTDSRMSNSVFARDFGGCIREGYILGRFREEIRFFERTAYKNKMEELGIPIAAECTQGLFEGGDFTFLDDNTIAIGMVARSNPKGIEEIQEQLSKYGYKVIGVPCDEEYLHFDLCFNMVDAKLALAYREALPESFLKLIDEMGIETIDVPAESIFELGCNVQALGDKRVISLKQNTYANEEMRKRGIKVTEVDITEIVKAGGGPHCMTFPLSRI